MKERKEKFIRSKLSVLKQWPYFGSRRKEKFKTVSFEAMA